MLPSYFKNRAAPCCDRFEYGLFTEASTLVVRVCVCSSLILPSLNITETGVDSHRDWRTL